MTGRPSADAARAEERERIRERALGLLARREHGVSELCHKLTRKLDADEATIRAVVEELASRDLVSDRRFAEAWARDAVRLKPRAERRVVNELIDRGVPARVAAPAVRAAFEEDAVDDRALALRLARAYAPRVEGRTLETRWRRLAGHLQRRGFDNALVYDVLSDVLPAPRE